MNIYQKNKIYENIITKILNYTFHKNKRSINKELIYKILNKHNINLDESWILSIYTTINSIHEKILYNINLENYLCTNKNNIKIDLNMLNFNNIKKFDIDKQFYLLFHYYKQFINIDNIGTIKFDKFNSSDILIFNKNIKFFIDEIKNFQDFRKQVIYFFKGKKLIPISLKKGFITNFEIILPYKKINIDIYKTYFNISKKIPKKNIKTYEIKLFEKNKINYRYKLIFRTNSSAKIINYRIELKDNFQKQAQAGNISFFYFCNLVKNIKNNDIFIFKNYNIKNIYYNINEFYDLFKKMFYILNKSKATYDKIKNTYPLKTKNFENYLNIYIELKKHYNNSNENLDNVINLYKTNKLNAITILGNFLTLLNYNLFLNIFEYNPNILKSILENLFYKTNASIEEFSTPVLKTLEKKLKNY